MVDLVKQMFGFHVMRITKWLNWISRDEMVVLNFAQRDGGLAEQVFGFHTMRWRS